MAVNSLSFVYPMFNEKDNIRETVSESLRVGKTVTPDVEIVIVDDKSTDGSGAIADELAAQHPEVKVIHHERNRRLGGSLKSGFGAATKEWVLYIDSDLPIKMDDALNAIPLTDNADVIIGWRKSRAESWKREVISKVYNRIIRYGFGLRVVDVNFSFKLFRRALLEKIVLTSEGSFIDAEFLLEVKRAGAKIAEIGMDYYPRVAGESTLASNSVILKILLEMWVYYREAHGRAPENFGGERRRLWLERRREQGDTAEL